jgi:hypothetical protein
MPDNEKENKDIKDLLEHLEIAKHPHSCHTIALDAHRYHHALTELIEKLEMLEYHNKNLMDVNAALHRRRREQRDEARIEICAFVHSESVVEHFRTGEGVISPEQVAEDRGWDCFSKEKRS